MLRSALIFPFQPGGPAQAMGAILAASPSPGLVGVARINWSSFFAAQPKVPCFLENFQHHKKSTGPVLRVQGAPLASFPASVRDRAKSEPGKCRKTRQQPAGVKMGSGGVPKA